MSNERADRTNVAALIPAYGEEARIADVVRRVLAELDHVLVIDDGSPDGTALAAERAGAEVIRHSTNLGKGAAIKTGFKALAEKPIRYVLLLDGDGQHLPEEIPAFLAHANASNSHFIIGSRMQDIKTMPFVRRCTNEFMSWWISKRCGQVIPDTQCGFRMMGLEVIPHLFCESNAFDYETEMLLNSARQGFQISSVPVATVYGDEKSKIRPIRDTIRFIRLMAR